MRSELAVLIRALAVGVLVNGCPSPAVRASWRETPKIVAPASENLKPFGEAGFSGRTKPFENLRHFGNTEPDKSAKPHVDTKILENYCEKLMSVRRSIYYLNTRNYKMSLQLRGIYTQEEAIFFCLRLYNHSHIDYGVDSIRFCAADDRQLKKSPAEGTSMIPICHCGNARLIKGKTGELCVFALPRFTLTGRKRLVIEVLEKNGGRHLRLLTDNYTLVKARLI